MITRKSLSVLLLSGSLSIYAGAQTTYLQLGQEDYQVLDRLETRSGRISNDLFLSVKPVSRKSAVQFLLETRDQAGAIGLTSIDRYNIDHAISVSGEWAPDEDGAIDARRPWFNTFYKKQPDFAHVRTDNFFLVVNPVIGGLVLSENSTAGGSQTRFSNSRGLELRGWIAKKVGFYTFFTDNQEDPVSFVTNWTNKYSAVPGADYYQTADLHGTGSANKYDYLLARGYIDFAAVKDHINVTLGYDKHFFGDGMRSLFLSDFSTGATFLRLNTKIWKINYQNLYLELTPQYPRGGDRVLPHKYATVHHLSFNATKWLNIGLFESVVFSRPDRYSFSYMVPIILYRQIERANGSPDNVLLGLNFKALAAKRLQFYGQFLLDEFRVKELTAGNGWWGNKFGAQLGAKYFDAFTVRNLDLQAEVNLVRPFTYAHDTLANYNHYNQPLAHPLGSGFAELIGVVRYQPVKNLFLTVRGMYYAKGTDTGIANYGNDISRHYGTRTPINLSSPEHGYTLISGVQGNCFLLNVNASYELRENLFIDLGVTNRNFSYENNYLPAIATTYFYGGLRLNLARRDYDFY